MSWRQFTALELGRALREKQLSPLEVTQTLLEREDPCNAFLSLHGEQALERAKALEGHLPDSPIAGVPMGVKDNICTEYGTTTCASAMLSRYQSPYEATAVTRLNAAGGILLGKTNLDEFAMGSTGETSLFGAVKNPWDLGRCAGGSSSGSAAAVATGQCFYALGSDTGGSIRLPAAWCGVTGMKPTYGTVSRYGLIAHAPSLDTIGPIARTAADCAAVLDAIRGQDSRDATSQPSSDSLLEGLDGDVRMLKIGVLIDWFGGDMSTEWGIPVLDVAKVLGGQGVIYETCFFPVMDRAVAAYYVLSSAEASSELGRYDGLRYGHRSEGSIARTRGEGFGWEVKRRIMLGAYALSAGHYEDCYLRALGVREQLRRAFEELFQCYDVLLAPVSCGPAPKLGQERTALELWQGDRYTVPASLAGLPAISIPCGFDRQGMPLGAQLIGPAFGDRLVLNAAHAFQMATDWHQKRPKGGGWV